MPASSFRLRLLRAGALCALPALAGGQPVGGAEFQVNTYTRGDQDTSFTPGRVVAADANGSFLVVWNSAGQDGSGSGIFGQRYDSDGQPAGAEFRVNSYITGSQSRPSVAKDASGSFVVVWNGLDGDDTGIFGRRFDGAGSPRGPEFRVNTTTSGTQENAAVATQPGGDFVVVWESEIDESILGQRYDGAGNPRGTEFQVNTTTEMFQYTPSLAADSDGDFVVVWASSTYGYGGVSSVFGQRYDSGGAPQGAEFRVTARGSPPSVASAAGGNFVVVWHVWGAYGGDEIYGRRYDGEGTPLGPEFHVNTFEDGYQERPAVASDGSGNFLVVWASRDQDGSSGGVFGQRYDGAGEPRGDEFQVNTYTTNEQNSSSIAATGSGEFTAVWTSDNQDGSGEGVFGKRISAGPGAVTVRSPNTNVKWRVGSHHTILWTHDLGPNATFRIELDRDDDGSYEELIAAAAPADGARGHFGWTVSGPPSGSARVRVSWTDDPGFSDASDVTFQIRPAPLSATESLLKR
jgi:hypothetical protein